MAVVVSFPRWRVETAADALGAGDPRWLIDPRGQRWAVQEVLRRRMIAPCDPHAPLRHETLVTAEKGLFLLSKNEGDETWDVELL